jgi:hypothetical protein
MTTYITIFDANQDKNINLHGYILGSERKLIAQNQALERVNRGKFRLDGADDEEDETEARRCPEGKGRPGGVAAAIDALNVRISRDST